MVSPRLRRVIPPSIERCAKLQSNLAKRPTQSAKGSATMTTQNASPLGMVYGQHSDYESALKPFQGAAELSLQYPQAHYNLSWTY